MTDEKPNTKWTPLEKFIEHRLDGPLMVSQAIYDRAKAEGMDMTNVKVYPKIPYREAGKP